MTRRATPTPRKSKPPAEKPQKDATPPTGGVSALTSDAIERLLEESRLDGRLPGELGTQDVELWIKSKGWTPVEFLTHTYRNPYHKMEHRISAAKAVLEYAHRKLPQKIELDADIAGRSVQIDAAQLTKLSEEELKSLYALLEKAT